MSVSATEPGPGAVHVRQVATARHPARWFAAAILILFVAAFGRAVVSNDRFQWSVVGKYLFDSRVLDGVRVTVELTVLSMVIGIALGIVLALMRLSPNPLLSSASWTYIWFFRGTPLLVQLLFWYNIAALFRVISLGVPFGPAIVSGNANQLVTAYVASLVALSLNEAAYMAEIVRAGITSVDEGQTHAAQSLGMRRLQIMRHIVLPQAMRVIVPPTGNETISMLKNTSLISITGYAELLYSVQQIYGVTYQTIPLLIVASLWYLLLTSVLYLVQHFIERRYSRGASRAQEVAMWTRLRELRRGARVA